MVETSDEWIVSRTGIRERRVSGPDEFTSDLALAAIRDLEAQGEGSLAGVDLIIVATSTPDYGFPSVACVLQDRLGLTDCGAIDVNAVCAGFTYALHLANGLISAGLHRKVLVVGAETLTKVTDYGERSNCILWGDGAGVVIVEVDDRRPMFLAAHLGSSGEGGRHLYRSGLSRRMAGLPLAGDGLIIQNGREVYKWAVTAVPQGIEQLLKKACLNAEDVDWFVPHSANLRILHAICERLGIRADRLLSSVELHGNTSSASIPLALAEALRDGRIRPGQVILLYGFGGGLVHAGVLLRW